MGQLAIIDEIDSDLLLVADDIEHAVLDLPFVRRLVEFFAERSLLTNSRARRARQAPHGVVDPTVIFSSFPQRICWMREPRQRDASRLCKLQKPWPASPVPGRCARRAAAHEG